MGTFSFTNDTSFPCRINPHYTLKPPKSSLKEASYWVLYPHEGLTMHVLFIVNYFLVMKNENKERSFVDIKAGLLPQYQKHLCGSRVGVRCVRAQQLLRSISRARLHQHGLTLAPISSVCSSDFSRAAFREASVTSGFTLLGTVLCQLFVKHMMLNKLVCKATFCISSLENLSSMRACVSNFTVKV